MSGRLHSPGRFGLSVLLWLLPLTALWRLVADWTSVPVARIAHVILGNWADDWVRTVTVEPGLIAVDTWLRMQVPGQGWGELVVEADPARHGYGLPLYLALLLAARTPRPVWRGLVGYGLLLVPQSFSLCLDLLRQMVMLAPGGVAELGIGQWQLEAIALGHQLGSLLLPTLAPVLVWLWLAPRPAGLPPPRVGLDSTARQP